MKTWGPVSSCSSSSFRNSTQQRTANEIFFRTCFFFVHSFFLASCLEFSCVKWARSLPTGCSFFFLSSSFALSPFFSPSVLSSKCLDSYGAIFSFSVLYKKRINNPAVNEKLKKSKKGLLQFLCSEICCRWDVVGLFLVMLLLLNWRSVNITWAPFDWILLNRLGTVFVHSISL